MTGANRPLHLNLTFSKVATDTRSYVRQSAPIPEPSLQRAAREGSRLGQLFSPGGPTSAYPAAMWGIFPTVARFLRSWRKVPVKVRFNRRKWLRRSSRWTFDVVQNKGIFPQPPACCRPPESSGRHGHVADDADDLVLAFQLLTRLDHAVGRGYAGTPAWAGVVTYRIHFPHAYRSRSPSILPERMEPSRRPVSSLSA